MKKSLAKTLVWTIPMFLLIETGGFPPDVSAETATYDYQHLFEMADEWGGDCGDLFWLISSWHKPVDSVPTPTPGDLVPTPTPTPTYSGHVTEFPGGTLNDLRALSANLTFDHLVISGRLNLPLAGSVSLSVNSLTLTSSGSVGYTRGECDYLPAPDFSVQAVERVVIDGEILLFGRSGTRVTSSATCNSCYGCDGGDVRIEANEIVITGSIENYGGAGSTSVDSWGSSGCSGGDAGGIYLTATTLSVYQGTLHTKGGQGGTGYISGEPNHGADGEPGPVELIVADLFEMEQSSMSTDGTLTLQAGRTDVYGPLSYGEILENIGGSTDNVAPTVNILSPSADSTISVNDPLQVRVQVSDAGTGVKEVQVTGLGHDQLHSGSEFVGGVLTLTISKPTTPASLQVVAWDNKGNSASASVAGLSLEGDLLIPVGETYVLSDDLNLGSASTLNVQGTMIIQRGSSPSISAGSLVVASGGRIEIEEPVDTLQTKAPSLTFLLADTAEIVGTVDVSGHIGLPEADENSGEEGGDFTLVASSISIPGNIYANGGDGKRRPYGWPVQYIGGAGGPGGTILLSATGGVTISGTVKFGGGDSVNTGLGPVADGADGGSLTVSYSTVADFSGATFAAAGGTANDDWRSGTPVPGQPGSIWIDYRGSASPAPVIPLDETEPNNLLIEAQVIFFPARLNGAVSSAEQGDLFLTYDGGTTDDLEDLFVVSLQSGTTLTLELDPVSDSVDLDLYVINASGLGVEGSSASSTLGATEQISFTPASSGIYLVVVSQWETPQTSVESAYTLTVTAEN